MKRERNQRAGGRCDKFEKPYAYRGLSCSMAGGSEHITTVEGERSIGDFSHIFGDR